MSSYDRTIEALEGLEWFGVRLGLDTMRAVCERRGDPQRRFPVIHVAGTNGKGTTIAALEVLALASGKRTGVYTSPHLVDFRERIRVEGDPIGDDAVVARWRALRECVGAGEMTYFEATTMIAFEHLASSAIDLGLIEVGLGGRLDATNVVDPEIAVVTAIDLDHQAHLGADRTQIAREKAGIFEAGRPALVGIVDAERVRPAIAEVAYQRGTEARFFEDEVAWRIVDISRNGTRFAYRGSGTEVEIALPLVGELFARDAALAMWVWETWTGEGLDPDTARSALSMLRPAGRFERASWRDVDVVFDVAHNPAAIDGLLAAVEMADLGRPAVVSGFLADKAWPKMSRRLSQSCSPHYVCGLETPPLRRRLEREVFEAEVDSEARWADTVGWGLARAARAVARGEADFVLVTGSFHTVGEALVATGQAAAGAPYTPPASVAGVEVA